MTMPKQVVVTGVAGRMGALLVRLVHDAADFSLLGGTDKTGAPAVGTDVGLAAGLEALGVLTVDALDALLPQADVVIDFTSAEASVAHGRMCAAAQVPLVVGSTGFSPAGKAALAEAAQQVPLVLAANMSMGMNVLIETAKDVARRLGHGYDIEVLEAHHRLKRDAPSGTALQLAEAIAASTTCTHAGQARAQLQREIPVHALRGGDVVGEHTVFFLGDGESVELTHRAHNRETFGRGALQAARWVLDKPPGLYGMAQVLNLPWHASTSH